MRVLLLLLGCLVLGAVLVEAHRDRAESDIEAKNEGVQGDFVKEREIRSTGGKKKKNRPSLKSTAGVFSALSRPTKTLSKRSIAESPSDQKRRKKCPGCYTSLLVRQPQILAAAPVKRKQRDSEVHEKIGKKNRRLKDKSKSKRRRNKEHKERERHAIIQTEYPEIGENNNKRHKNHHRGRKDKGHHHPGGLSSISSILPEMKTQTDIGHTETEYPEIGENNNRRHKNHHRGRKDKGHHHAGGLSSISSILPEMKTQTDIGHTEDITN